MVDSNETSNDKLTAEVISGGPSEAEGPLQRFRV